MYAIIEYKSKQYKIYINNVIKVDKLNNNIGDLIDIDHIIMIHQQDDIILDDKFLKKSKIVAEIVGHGRDKKINVIKFKRRKHSIKQQGHRQYFTCLKIKSINY